MIINNKRFQKTEKILYSYKYLKAQLQRDVYLLKSMEPDVSTSIVLNDAPTNKSPGDPTAITTLQFIEKKDQIEKRIELSRGYVRSIDKVLTYLDPLEREIVELKYFRGIQNYRIIMELGDRLSDSTFYRMRENIVEKFALMLWGVDEK